MDVHRKLFLHVEAVVGRLVDTDTSWWRACHHDTGGAGLCNFASEEVSAGLRGLGWEARPVWTNVVEDPMFSPFYPLAREAGEEARRMWSDLCRSYVPRYDHCVCVVGGVAGWDWVVDLTAGQFNVDAFPFLFPLKRSWSMRFQCSRT